MLRQGNDGRVQRQPMEITDPPEFLSEALVQRFPELKPIRGEWRQWWQSHRLLLETMREQLEALTERANQ